MDTSLSSDCMDWEEDSSLHIIQPASSPWRKRTYDTYNDTNGLYHTDDAYSPYPPTLLDVNAWPAQYATDFDGNIVLQPIIEQQPQQPIGYYLPELVKWLIYGTAQLVCGSIQLTSDAYKHTAKFAVQAGSSAKRRLIEITQNAIAPVPAPAPAPPPPSRKRRHSRRSHIIRRISPTSPGGRTHLPVTPPRARPRATLDEPASINHDCIVDYIPSKIGYVRSGAFVTSFKDGHQIAPATHHPYYEPLMSGALQDVEMEEIVQSGALQDTAIDENMQSGAFQDTKIDEDVQLDVTPVISPYHIPGTFPDSPAPTVLTSTELSIPEPQASEELTVPQDLDTKEKAASDEQPAEEIATQHSEASDEPDIPDVQSTIQVSLQQVDSRPRNYKGELLDDWQIKICKEFQAIHPPPRDVRRQATNMPEQRQGLNPTGLIETYRSPLANAFPLTPHQRGSVATGLNDSRRSPVANVSPITPHQRGTIATGLSDSRQSPVASELYSKAADGTMNMPGSTNGILYKSHGMTTIVSNDLHRSPLDLHRATSEDYHQPPCGTTPLGLSDLHRSPLADVSPMRACDVLNDSRDTGFESSHAPPATASIGSTNSLRSPLVDISPVNSQHETITNGSINSPRSPLVDESLIHMQLRTSPTGSIHSPVLPLAASSQVAVVDALTDTDADGPEASNDTRGATPLPLKNPPTSPSGNMTTTPATSTSKWSIRSLYARVQSKPKKRSPLCERINNGNIHKVRKTPKKVTWPETGPVTATKRFMKHEPMSHPSPASSREESIILSSASSDISPRPSPTMLEEEAEAVLNSPYQAYPTKSTNDNWSMGAISSNGSNMLNPVSTIEHMHVIHKSGEEEIISSSSSSDNEASVKSVETPTKTTAADPSTPPSLLSPNFEELTISTRRSSLRRREKEDQAQKLREKIAAEEKARKEKEEAEEKARKEKEEAEEKARIKAEEEEERKKTGGRRIPIEKVIQSLPPAWDEKVRINMAKGMREQLAMTSVGNPLTRRDFGMVLPQPGTGDDPSGWLNDEIISGYLQAVVDHGHRVMGHPRGAKPRMHAFSPFFYTTLKERGYDAVKRWSSRAKIGGNDLKNVEYVFIPCNPSRSHWTIIVVSPVRKTIEVFDSMHGSSVDKVDTTKKWLRGEMGRSFVDSEWTVVEDPALPGRGKGPVQNNANDCGVFAVTTAKMLVLGVDPMAVSAGDMPLQRRRLVAELLNGGFSGEFEPSVVFE